MAECARPHGLCSLCTALSLSLSALTRARVGSLSISLSPSHLPPSPHPLPTRSAAVEAVEAALAINYPGQAANPATLSTQIATSCSAAKYMTVDYLSGGCAGGYPDEAMGAMAYKVNALVSRSHLPAYAACARSVGRRSYGQDGCLGQAGRGEGGGGHACGGWQVGLLDSGDGGNTTGTSDCRVDV